MVLSVEPHWLAVDAIQAAAGASAFTYFSSFFHTFSPLSLAITYACGCPLGLLFWSVAWDIARPLLPATLQQYTQSWVEGGLVAGELQRSSARLCAVRAPPPVGLAALPTFRCESSHPLPAAPSL